MTDASEHLAPVSYLPWAVPGVTGADQGEPDQGAGERAPERSTAERDGAGGGAGDGGGMVSDFGRPRRSGRGEPNARFGAAGSRRAASDVGATDADAGGSGAFDADVEREERELESGAQRDERIDRLVVSRLRRSALSISEVRGVLVEHGLHDIEVEEWIERYERLGYLDDARLAEQLVHVNATRKGRGSGAILQELSRRGIEAQAARHAVADLDPETELDNARTTAERRARQLRGLDRQTAERRLSAFLQRRGYGGEVVRQVVTEVLAADGS
ncbi:regulatory protein [Agromyces sp. CF514]|uniref:regulatory protein RecX n=1 Tax=Agromyces sp. CF514 TaxID=1881031 RepID=UPI0008F0DE95|nr:regulatory protein RecX [Agromyces sp. CF514]SFR88643.1 regulatory protein [Agromyces sp. CF514]